jgi:hypothetical protein
MNVIPLVLLQYMQGLKTHDLNLIALSVADEARVVLPKGALAKSGFLAFLTALYAAFPDWDYKHDAPESSGENRFAVKWYQSGTHTDALILPERGPVPATGKRIRIPAQFFFYHVDADKIIEIRPEAVPGGAPWGILEQLCIPDPM